ncbi:MAG: 50S ribosomal protein L14e [Candidatus Bathyarchaeota archaeon]|nr:50S ribosomal protein L14e [Candidatus Bathyarchaeota archaeon]
MPAIEVGRICVKISGREAGRKCIVLDVIDKNFALITGPREVTGVKRRRVNINHIEPTMEKIEIKRGASDEEVIEALKKANKLDDMKSIVKISLA